MNKILYNVRTDYGGTFVKHVNGGDLLTLDELSSLIGELQALHDTLVERNTDQEKYRTSLYTVALKPLIDECRLHYPCNLPYIDGVPNVTIRPSKAKRYSGVYFATHEDFADLVKIGCSIDVYKRSKSLFNEFNKKPVKVIGFIETAKPYDIEGYIHHRMSRHHKTNEWFHKEPVCKWLEWLVTP